MIGSISFDASMTRLFKLVAGMGLPEERAIATNRSVNASTIHPIGRLSPGKRVPKCR